MWIMLPAGTWNSVVCTHWPKYDTQSGCELTVFCGSSCITTFTTAPVFGVTPVPYATVAGPARK